MVKCLTYVSILMWLITALRAQTFFGENPCTSKTICHECIQTPSCAWCSEPPNTFNKDHPRCFQPVSEPLHKQCDSSHVYFPSNVFEIMQMKILTKGRKFSGGGAAGKRFGGGTSGGRAHDGGFGEGGGFDFEKSEIVRITPQRVHLKLRARESSSIRLQYAEAADFPVDLYYLMDLSKSMKDDKGKLSVLGNLLAETIPSITQNFQLGFGSFVGEVVSTGPPKSRPCTNCTAIYGYKHHLSLNTDTTKFSEMVRSANVSENLDAPGGGFGAIMQAVACTDRIGWRRNAKKIIVLATNDGFHFAGDEKLGGSIRSTDGYCHLENNRFGYSNVEDYPNIAQLNAKIKQKSINVIFAVPSKQISVYENLRNYIEGASSAILSADPSNVAELVKNQYESISSTIELKDNATDGVTIKYYSRCLDTRGELETNTNTCDGLKVGQVIDFRLEVYLKECPKDRSKLKQIIQIYPVGIAESLIIDLELLCTCPCEQPEHPGFKEASEYCLGHGTYKCGICDCEADYAGESCECKQEALEGNVPFSGCRPPGSTDTVDCSGKGICICNQCDCEKRSNFNETITGAYCECDNYSCYRHDGQICGGHGKCVCGHCVCDVLWTGEACECYNDNSVCYRDNGSEVCDGHGGCVCGVCYCHTTENGHYTGKFCEKRHINYDSTVGTRETSIGNN